MEVIIERSRQSVGAVAAGIVVSKVIDDPACVLGFATGSSPLPLYGSLERAVAKGLDLRRVTGFALDEYVGVPPEHPASYHAVIDREVTARLSLDPTRIRVPDGCASDLPRACLEYERCIKASGGVDVQILGIGADGHIGFNEPMSSLSSRTRVKTLTEQTRQDNARYFSDLADVPHHCVTQGIATILEARHLLLIATGSAKAGAVAAAIEGPVAAVCPASAIQLHQRATVILDDAAAGRLRYLSYYKEIQTRKPKWQRPPSMMI